MRRIMQRAAPAIVALCCLTCSSLDNLAIDVTGTAVIDEGTPLEQLLPMIDFLGFGDIDITQSQQFQNQGYTKDDIDSVRIEQMTLTITSPETADFDFLNSIAFFAEAEGLPRVEIASIASVPEGVDVLQLEVNEDAELRPYVIAETMTVTTEANGNRPPDETTIEAALLFDVDVNLDRGLCD